MKHNFKHFSRLFFYSIALCFVLGSLSFVNAQTVSGTMQGRVTDSNGDAVAGATVNIKNLDTGQLRTLTTNEEGFYNAPFLPIGRYEVDATGQGFNKIVKPNLDITLNNTTVADFQLAPGVSGEVTVTAEAPQINSSNQQVTSSLSNEQIQERPVANQTNFLTLAETFTGYQENPNSGVNNPTASGGSSINFNGTGTRGATFQINGVNNDDSSENQNRQGVSLATVKEFQVISNTFTAEFGRGYGAVVLVQTLSGTNQLRGSAYIFHNNSSLNAKSFFAHGPKAVNRRNQFGATAGFPILKNKLFGFVSFDRTENTGANNYRRDVFTLAERNEANWFTKTPANDTPGNRDFIRSIINRFPSNVIPNDPNPQFFRTYNGQQNIDFPAEDYSGRFDWNPRQSDTVFARFQYTRQQFTADDVIPGERADQNNKQRNLGLTWTHVFSPQLVGEFRYGLGLRTTLVNIANGNQTPIVRFFNPGFAGGATTIGNAAGFPIQRYQTDHQFVYNMSWVLGSNHFLKFGTDIRNQALDDLADNTSRGFWNFTLVNNTSCNAVTYTSGFDSFLNGCVNNFQKGFGNFYLENRLAETNLYAEDNWKILPNLTLNLGMRYEYVKAPREVENRIDYQYGNDTDNWEPRIGFAYSPNFESGPLGLLFGSGGRSSIRGGYGVYHGRMFQSVFAQSGASVRTNTPNAFFFNQTSSATVASDPNTFRPTNLQNPLPANFSFTPGIEPTARYAKSLLVDPNLEMPYTKQWNFTYERQLPWETALRITYTGNRGYGLPRYNLFNTPSTNPNGVLVANHPNNAPSVLYTLGSLPANDPRRVDVRGQVLRAAADFQCAGTGLSGVATTTQCPFNVPLGDFEYSLRVPRTNERRPDGRYTQFLEVSNGAFTWYDGLQIEINKRLSHNINFQIAYTRSEAYDTTSEATAQSAGDSNQTGNNLKISRAYSRMHTPHRFTFFGTVRNPYFDKRTDWVGQILGGWQLSTVFRWVHGNPFSITATSADFDVDGFSEPRPAIVDYSVLGRTVADPSAGQTLLPPSAFRTLTANDIYYGCCMVGRNVFYADGLRTFDFGLSKKFPMPIEGHSLTVRADFFNAFNKVQFAAPNTAWTATSTTFGVVSGVSNIYQPRNIQISLRYLF